MDLSFVIARLCESSKPWWWGLVVVASIAGIVGCGGSPIPTPVPSPISTLQLRPLPTRMPTPMLASPTEPILRREARIEVGDDYFYPEIITVTVGARVQWVHVGQKGHNVMAMDDSWGIPFFQVGDIFTETFPKVGVYEYGCTPHLPGMRGKVVVIQ